MSSDSTECQFVSDLERTLKEAETMKLDENVTSIPGNVASSWPLHFTPVPFTLEVLWGVALSPKHYGKPNVHFAMKSLI